MRQKRYLFPAAEIINGLLVVEDVRFRLVDGRSNLAELKETFELGRADVANAQRAYLTFPIQCFTLLPDFIKCYLTVRREAFAETCAAERQVPA